MSTLINSQHSSGRDAEGLEYLLAERRSCRSFQARQVPARTIKHLISLAQRSASWSNTQPWQVVITRGKGTKRLRTSMETWARTDTTMWDFPEPTEYRGIYRERRRACAAQLYKSVGIAWGDREASARQSLENFRFFGAPHLAVVTSPLEYGAYGALDAGIYIGNFLLAAQALGLAAIPQAAIAAYSPQIRAHLEIPDGRGVLAGISFGYAREDHPTNSYRTPRATPDEAVTFVDA